jgi:hypothetical protein
MNLTYCVKTNERSPQTFFSRKQLRSWGVAVLLLCGGLARPCPVQAELACPPDNHDGQLCFEMVPSADAAACLPDAHGRVRIKSEGSVEKMDVAVEGLPANTGFDFFVIQVPNSPFGLSWYQGDMETNNDGKAHGQFAGRFNTETFVVAPNVAPAPVVHEDAPFPDANMNPKTAPVHMFHLGLWFDSPTAAGALGCPGRTTPFNGNHTAGIQALSTRNFDDDQGPLRQLVP